MRLVHDKQLAEIGIHRLKDSISDSHRTCSNKQEVRDTRVKSIPSGHVNSVNEGGTAELKAFVLFLKDEGVFLWKSLLTEVAYLWKMRAFTSVKEVGTHIPICASLPFLLN